LNASPSTPISVNKSGDTFMIHASDYQKRFNHQVSGSLNPISQFDILEVYPFRTYEAQLEDNIRVSILSDGETDNIMSITLKVSLLNDENSHLVQKYMLCIYHSCDPTATAEDNARFLQAILDMKYSSYDNSYSSDFYEKNNIKYRLSMDLNQLTLLVIPSLS
jgi:hypothetical protein